MDLEDRKNRFIRKEGNLDAMYWLTQGLSYREIAERIGRPHSFVQRVNNFLKHCGAKTGGQWRIDVNAMAMTKTYKLYEYSPDWPREVVDNDDFLTYFAEIKRGKSGHFAMYTFPNEIKPVGESTSPYYYNIPKFKAPLLDHDLTFEKFKEIFESENNESPLPPRGKTIDPDIIHIEIARYVELFGIPGNNVSNKDMKKLFDAGLNNVNFSGLVDIVKEDIEDKGLADKVDVTYDIVRNRYNEMLKKHIIYPGFGLDMRRFRYALSFCWINTKDIYRIIRTFSHFNIICALAYTQDRYLLHLQYPKNKETDIYQILNDLDPQNEVFKILRVHYNRTLPHVYYFEKEKDKTK